MPDSDKVHARLPGPYQDAYKQLCEGQQAIDIARSLERGLRRSLKHHGEEAPALIRTECARLCEDADPFRVCEPADKKRFVLELEQAASTRIPRKRAASLAIKAMRWTIDNDSTADGDLADYAMVAYVREVFRDSFESKLQMTPKHDLDVPHDVIEERMVAVRHIIEIAVVPNFARQMIASNGSLKALKLSRRPNKREVPLSQNLDRL